MKNTRVRARQTRGFVTCDCVTLVKVQTLYLSFLVSEMEEQQHVCHRVTVKIIETMPTKQHSAWIHV